VAEDSVHATSQADGLRENCVIGTLVGWVESACRSEVRARIGYDVVSSDIEIPGAWQFASVRGSRVRNFLLRPPTFRLLDRRRQIMLSALSLRALDRSRRCVLTVVEQFGLNNCGWAPRQNCETIRAMPRANCRCMTESREYPGSFALSSRDLARDAVRLDGSAGHRGVGQPI